MTAVGSKRIEEIQKGDIVLSYDDNVGRYEEMPVTDIFVNETDELTEIKVGDETIVCTLGHMFLTADGWKKAGDLTTEDVLRTLSKDQQITEISKKKLASKIRVYNLSVMGCHTYAVGKAGVIVHNSCGPVPNDKVGQDYKMANRKSTGRFESHDVLEQISMRYAKAYPKNGKILPFKMNDSTWSNDEGWVKMQQVFRGTWQGQTRNISIHYVMNDKLKLVDDFKFAVIKGIINS